MKTKTDTISASSLETRTLDDKVAKRIKVYEFDNKLGCYKEKLANLTEGQSYMAVEFKKMQEEMKSLKECVYLLQTNLEYRRKVSQTFPSYSNNNDNYCDSFIL